MKPAEVPLLWIVVSTRSRLSAFSCAAADAPSSASTRSAARIFTQPERSALAKEELSGAGRPALCWSSAPPRSAQRTERTRGATGRPAGAPAGDILRPHFEHCSIVDFCTAHVSNVLMTRILLGPLAVRTKLACCVEQPVRAALRA